MTFWRSSFHRNCLFETILKASLQCGPQPMSTYSQCIKSNSELFSQELTMFDLRLFFILIVLEDERSVVGAQLFDAAIQAVMLQLNFRCIRARRRQSRHRLAPQIFKVHL